MTERKKYKFFSNGKKYEGYIVEQINPHLKESHLRIFDTYKKEYYNLPKNSLEIVECDSNEL